MLLPITLALNPTSALKDGGYRIEGMQVDAAPVDVKGIRCTRLHLKGNSRTVTSTLDADREHGWIPIQWRVVANRRTTLEVALEYDLSESAPRLKNWVLTTHGGGFNSWKGRMLRLEVDPDESLLAIDTRRVPPEIADEATKVRRIGTRIVAIGKDLTDYDALDTGVFVFSPLLFEALDRARALGDTTLSGGVRQLAARGLMRGVEIGDAVWCDIDTVSDLAAAESALGAPSA